MADVKLLEQQLRTAVGDPRIRVITLATRCQIVCRETDEKLVEQLAAHCAPLESVEVIGL